MPNSTAANASGRTILITFRWVGSKKANCHSNNTKIGTAAITSRPPFRVRLRHSIRSTMSAINLPLRTIKGKVMLTNSQGIFSLAMVYRAKVTAGQYTRNKLNWSRFLK